MSDTNNDIFRGPKLKIERAKRHIGDYYSAFKTFTQSDAVRIFPQLDPNTRQILTTLYWDKPAPGDMLLTAADALYNLRSALDQAVCCCARVAGKSPKKTYFPHGADKARFEASMGEKCKEVPEPVRNAIAALEPYYGGHGYLFRALHDLNLVDKHTDLLSIALAVRKIAVEKNVPAPATGRIWQSREDKLELVDAANIINVDEDIKVTLAITFRDVDAIRGKPVMQVFNELSELVPRTISILEATANEWLATQTE